MTMTGHGWQAHLDLAFRRDGTRTVLARREHRGPLRVQRALHPEGDAPCHVLLLHPPAGIVGGDELDIRLELGAGTHALLTTPGANRWYRSGGLPARAGVHAALAAGARLEWMPQETQVYDGVEGTQSLRVDLADDARFLGWDLLCLGRHARGERLERGWFRTATQLYRNGHPLWLDWGTLVGGAGLLHRAAGWAGQPVAGTLVVAGLPDAPAAVRALRAAFGGTAPSVPGDDAAAAMTLATASGETAGGRWAATALPGVLVARWLGAACEPARHWFLACWQHLRPDAFGRAASQPRIWTT